MKINKKHAVTLTAVIGIVSLCGYGINHFVQRNRAIAVFNDTDEKYAELLAQSLPDGRDATPDIWGFICKIAGFDTRQPHTLLENSSAIFNDIDNETADVRDDKVTEEEYIPETTDEPTNILPTFSQICTASEISVNNATQYVADAAGACAEPLYIKPTDDGPQVLIVHTHTTECYDGDGMIGEGDRSTDETKNMTAVGARIKSVLEEYGIECVHDTTVHDYPTYQGAYTRELNTVRENLGKYPSVKVVLDVHRDAFVYSDGSKLKVEFDVNGENTAKVMLVCGTDALGLEHTYWRENFKFAAKIQNAAQIMYPDMMRPINLRKERFNMHTTTGSLILEVGANGNTLEQALKGGENVARAIAAVLLNQE